MRSLAPLALALLLAVLPALATPARGQGHGEHGSDPVGSDPRALELENETLSDPTGVLHREILRARADELQWVGTKDVAGARAADVLGSLGWSFAAGKGRGDFVSFELDAEAGRWRNYSVAPRLGATRIPWLAAIDARPFTHAHGPIVTGPTLRLFCQEEAAIAHDAPSGPLTIRTVLESEVRFLAAEGTRVEERGPRAFQITRDGAHAHLFFTRGTAILDGLAITVTLPANETVQFRAHAGAGAEGMHEANDALALRQLHVETHAFASSAGPLDYEVSWGASAVPGRVTPTLAEWNVTGDKGAAVLARVVIAGWRPATVSAYVDDVEIASTENGETPPAARNAGYLSLAGGVVEAWLPTGPGTHAIRLAESPAPKDTPALGEVWGLAVLGLAAARRKHRVPARAGDA